MAVNGDPCVSIDKIRGDIGSTVTLTVQSPGEQPRNIQIERGSIAGVIPPRSERLGRRSTIGYLRMASMAGQGTAVEDVLRDFTSKNPIDGLVVDLRHHPGDQRFPERSAGAVRPWKRRDLLLAIADGTPQR